MTASENFKRLVRNLRLKKHEKIEISKYEDSIPEREIRKED